MKNWKSSIINPSTPIIDAIKIIDDASLQIALVVDEKMHLLGTVTDGDIRRAILTNISLNTPVKEIMFGKPTVVSQNVTKDEIIEIIQRSELRQIPVVDETGMLVDLKILVEMISEQRLDNWVVLMAGGLGKRLGQLTQERPKPLLKVGDKPVLETILNNFREQGFYSFFISVNYMSGMIEEYFGNGAGFGVEIKYIREEEKLGTAGALSLLPEQPKQPFIVMNGDLLTKVNFSHLLDSHKNNKAMATMCVRKCDFQVPFGVVNIEHNKLISLVEKPVHSFFINSGIYVLAAETIKHIPAKTYFDMTTLFEKLLEQEIKTSVFPIHEYWLDIGKMDDYKRAAVDYQKYFESEEVI